jgi:hypothetical protein
MVTSMTDEFSATPTGSVSLLLPASGELTTTASALALAGPFAPLSVPAITATSVTVTLGHGRTPYRVTALSVSQAISGAPLSLTFTTSALPLLESIFRAESATSTIPSLTLSVRDRAGGGPFSQTFSRLRVSALAESVSGPFAGTATLAAAHPH